MNKGDRVQLIVDPENGLGTVDLTNLPHPPGAGWVTVDWGDGMPTYHREDELEVAEDSEEYQALLGEALPGMGRLPDEHPDERRI